MPSQSVKHQETRLRKVLSSAYAQAPRIAENLAAKLQPFLQPGDTMPDFRQVQELVGDWLEAISAKLAVSDQELALARKSLVQARVDLRHGAGRLRRELSGVRRFLDETLGLEVSKGLLPERNLGRFDVGSLQMVATQLVAVLREGQRFAQAAGAAGEGRRPTSAGLADALEERLAELRLVQAALEPGRRGVEMRLELKNRELADAIETLRRAHDLLFGIYRAAGYDYVAGSLGVKARKKAKAEEEPPEGEKGSTPPAASIGSGTPGADAVGGDFFVEPLADSA